jgi:hypothetical protein
MPHGKNYGPNYARNFASGNLGLGTELSLTAQRNQHLLGDPILALFADALVAYSLRQIKAGANVVRVRRDSDNAEADFTAAGVSDGTLESWVGAGNGLVRTWYDQIGTAHFQQANAASQPRIVNAGSLVTKNGKPSCEYDGVDDFMEATNPYSDGPVSVFAVKAHNNNTGVVYEAASTLVFGSSAGFRVDNYSGDARFGTFNGTTADFIRAANNTSDLQIHGAIKGVGSRAVYIDGSSIDSDNQSGTVDFTGVTVSRTGAFVGAGQQVHYYDGFNSEIIGFNTDESANRSAIESNQADYYGITLP